jgi:hypothetical protein
MADETLVRVADDGTTVVIANLEVIQGFVADSEADINGIVAAGVVSMNAILADADADVVATGNDRAAVAADKATVAADKATVAADKATVAADKAATHADKLAADAAAANAANSASDAADIEDAINVALGAGGADVALRADLIDPNGFLLIKHKRPGTGTFARTANDWVKLGPMDDQNIFNWIDPGLDAAIVAGTNAASLIAYFNNAHTDLPAAGGQRLIFPPYKFFIDNKFTISKPNIVLDMWGATLDADLNAAGAKPVLQFISTATDCTLNGGTLQESHNAPSSWQLDVNAPRLTVNNAQLKKPNKVGGAGSYQMYLRRGADGCVFNNMWAYLADGYYVEGSNTLFMGGGIISEAGGGDDAVVIKAIGGITEHVRLIGMHFENSAAMFSVGTELGIAGVNDPTHLNSQARGLLMQGCTGKNVACMLLIKPGASSAGADYRDAWTRGIRANNNVLIDASGSKMTEGLVIRASRGQWVSDVKGVGNVIKGRVSGDESTGNKDLIDIHAYDTAGSGSPKIDDVDLGVDYADAYNGAAFGTAGVPGYPMFSHVRVDDNTAGGNAITRVTLDVVANGCKESGVRISGGVANHAIKFTRLDLKNVSMDGAGHYGIDTPCVVDVPPDWQIDYHGSATLTHFTGTGALHYTSVPPTAQFDINPSGNLKFLDAVNSTAPATSEVELLFQAIATGGGRLLPRIRHADGSYTTLQSSLGRKSIAVLTPADGSNAAPIHIGYPTLTLAGTLTARVPTASANRATRARRVGYVSAAGAGSIAGYYPTAAAKLLYTLGSGAQPGGGFLAIFRWVVSDAAAVAGANMFLGMRSGTAAPLGTDVPSALANTIGVAQNNGSANLQIVYGGSAGQAPIDLGANFPAADVNTEYELILYARPDSAGVAYRVTNLNTLNVASGVLPTGSVNLPLNTAFLCPKFWRGNNATALAVGLDICSVYIESDL